MVSDSGKTLALVVSTIKNLCETKGSTTREILRYISSVYNISTQVARRQLQTALKRGVACGILKKNGGHYIVPISGGANSGEIASQEISLLDFCRRKRSRKSACKCKKREKRRRSRRSKRKESCKCKRKRSRRSRKRRSRRGSMCRPRRKRKCRCGGLGSKRDRNRMKRAVAEQMSENTANDESFELPIKVNNDRPSDCGSVSTVSTTVEEN
ncbi:uncharacterized protein LOC143175290 [Nomia melanderi]|uniref:uncharacterized protein LOC143175290 n=1 Tax=Nomia melanderi TaxID=2448451 RepID=UPI003FCD6879